MKQISSETFRWIKFCICLLACLFLYESSNYKSIIVIHLETARDLIVLIATFISWYVLFVYSGIVSFSASVGDKKSENKKSKNTEEND